jgi:hypothetical protein
MWKRLKGKLLLIALTFVLVSAGTGMYTSTLAESSWLLQQPYSMPTTTARPFLVANARIDTSFFNVPNVISGLGATRTLLTRESGSIIDLDRAAGIVLTLPAPAEGLYFDFIASVSVTSNAYKFSTATQGTDWILGSYFNVDTDTSNAVAAFTCNGTSHDNFSMNGTTAGGLLGAQFRLTAISTTVWAISGHNEGSGTVATACATS